MPNLHNDVNCTVARWNLKKEFIVEVGKLGQNQVNAQHRNAVLAGIINKERECKGFFKWDEGFSPKEHKEMIQDAQLEQLRQNQNANNAAVQANATLKAGRYGIYAAFGGVIVGTILSNTKTIFDWIASLFKP